MSPCRTTTLTPAAAAAFVLAVALLGGCGRTQQVDLSSGAPREVNNTPDPLIARGASRVTDLPVPTHFSYLESRSTATGNANTRYISHYYRGRASKERVASFYIDQMPANNRWFRENYRDDHGTLKIDFGKGDERCIITIDEDFWGYTTVHAEIYAIERQRS
jgi:hypothetical protein